MTEHGNFHSQMSSLGFAHFFATPSLMKFFLHQRKNLIKDLIKILPILTICHPIGIKETVLSTQHQSTTLKPLISILSLLVMKCGVDFESNLTNGSRNFTGKHRLQHHHLTISPPPPPKPPNERKKISQKS